MPRSARLSVDFARRWRMAENEMQVNRAVLLAFFGGAALGAVTAILAAPKSGRELCEDVIGFADTARLRLDAFEARAIALIDQGEAALDDVSGRGKKVLEKAKEFL